MFSSESVMPLNWNFPAKIGPANREQVIGPERFLAAYANGLDRLFGYENSPLEKMAYDAEALFKASSAIFDAEKFVVERLDCP